VTKMRSLVKRVSTSEVCNWKFAIRRRDVRWYVACTGCTLKGASDVPTLEYSGRSGLHPMLLHGSH